MDMQTTAIPYPGKLNPKRDMVVPINGQMYAVKTVPGPLIVNGQSTASKVQHHARLIEIDDIIPAAQRWRVAAIAVALAWESEVRRNIPNPPRRHCPFCKALFTRPTSCDNHIRRVHHIDPSTL